MDTLFLLKGGFDDEGKKWFCPGCAKVEGMLSYFPELREKVNVQYVDFARPRQAIIDKIGEENQGAPVLVLGAGVFIDDPEEIWAALSERYGVPGPHP